MHPAVDKLDENGALQLKLNSDGHPDPGFGPTLLDRFTLASGLAHSLTQLAVEENLDTSLLSFSCNRTPDGKAPNVEVFLPRLEFIQLVFDAFGDGFLAKNVGNDSQLHMEFEGREIDGPGRLKRTVFMIKYNGSSLEESFKKSKDWPTSMPRLVDRAWCDWVYDLYLVTKKAGSAVFRRLHKPNDPTILDDDKDEHARDLAFLNKVVDLSPEQLGKFENWFVFVIDGLDEVRA